jgi:hypothetical protein
MSARKKLARVGITVGATPEVAEEAVRNLVRAELRIGGAQPRKRARWLIEEFLATPPTELAPGEVMNRHHELGALVVAAMREQDKPPAAQMEFDIDPETLRAPWKALDDLVRRWVAGKPVALPSIEMTLERQKDGDDLRGKITTSTTGMMNNVLLAVARLLEDPAVRVRECPECGKLFVPERRQKRHLKCARQARDAKRPDRGKRKKKGDT